MVPKTERHKLIQLTGMLICACLVLKPLLLLGHLLTDDHCWRVDITECSESLELEFAHLGIVPHEHEHGSHAHEPHCHEGEDAAHHHSHCPLSIEEHLEKLAGEPADARGKAIRRLALPAARPGAVPAARASCAGGVAESVGRGGACALRAGGRSPTLPSRPPVA